MPMRSLLIIASAALFCERSTAQVAPLPSAEPGVLAVTYRLSSQPDSTSPFTRTEMMRLVVGKTLSKFESIGQSKMDSLTTAARQAASTQANMQLIGDRFMALPKSGSKYKIYKQAASGRVYCFDQIGMALYRYDERQPLFTWTITPTMRQVAGYACQRATTTFAGRQYEAWFTREVPIAEGPYKFYGLPGLIVKVEDVRNQYIFELTQLARISEPEQISLPEGRVTATTKKQFVQGRREYELTLLDKISAKGHAVSEQDRREYMQKLKSRNNPLELQ